MEDKKFYTKSELYERGWTKSMIKKFLGQPEVTYEHRDYGTLVSLYEAERVHLNERSEIYVWYQARRIKPKGNPELLRKWQAYRRALGNYRGAQFFSSPIFSAKSADNFFSRQVGMIKG